VNFTQFKLDPRLMAAVERAGYTAPTPVQEAAIPPALAGRDIIGTAQTGTGKTAAFVLPILQKLLTGPRNRTRALVIAPTRELAEQTHETFRYFAAGTGIRSATVYGGIGAASQIKALQNGTEVIVACPGRLLDLIGQRFAQLGAVEVLVLDEADRMFDMGFLPDIRRIISYVPKQRQTMLFSATFPKEVEQLAAQILNRPQRVAIGLICPAHTVSHALYPVTSGLKTRLLLAILLQTDTESVLIFTRTKHRAKRLAEQIERSGYKVTSLHGNLSQVQRQSALSGFKSGKYQIMVATDIAARGLDVEGISHVINYDMPDTADAYIHRIGRAGRAERSGDAFTLVAPEDNAMVRELEKIMNQELPQQLITGFNYDTPASTKPSFNSIRTHRAPSAPKAKPSSRRSFSSQGTAAAKKKPAEIYTTSGWRSLSHAI
jgi:ATP-dependent RNA helicase RhlE